MIGQSPVDRAVPVRTQHLRRALTITSLSLPGAGHLNTMCDTGSQMSIISEKLARHHRLHIHKPVPGEPACITLADQSKSVVRVGWVRLPVVIHFHGGTPRPPVHCTKQFEVLNISYDFIIGVDLIPQLFPTDAIVDFLILPSIITSPAVVVHPPSEQDRWGARALVYSKLGSTPTTHSASIVDSYLRERESASVTARLLAVFGDDLPEMGPAAAAAPTPSAVSSSSSNMPLGVRAVESFHITIDSNDVATREVTSSQ
jgi:hypothetical protein